MRIKNGVGTNTIFLTVFKLLTTIVGIVVTMILSKNLSLEQYGTYSQGNLIGTIGTSMFILGLSDAANYYFSFFEKDKDESDRYLSTILIIELIVGFVGFIVIASCYYPLSLYFNNQSLQNVVIWVAAVPMLTNLINIFQILFIATKKAKQIAVKNLIIAILKVGIVCVTCFFIKNIIFIFALILFIDVAQVIYFYISLRLAGMNLKLKNFKPSAVLEILKYSIPIALYVFLNALFKDVDKFIVGGLVSTEEFGVFANVSKALPFDILSVSLLTLMIPAVTKNVINNNNESIEKLYRHYFLIATLSTWTLGITAIFASKELILFLYGSNYTSGNNVFIVYIFTDLIKIYNFYLIISAKKKGLVLALTSLISLVFNIALDYLLFFWLGTIGVAIATLIVTALNNFAILFISRHYFHFNLRRVIDIKFVIFFICEASLLFAGLYFLIRYLQSIKMYYLYILLITYTLSCSLMLVTNIPFIKKTISGLNDF